MVKGGPQPPLKGLPSLGEGDPSVGRVPRCSPFTYPLPPTRTDPPDPPDRRATPARPTRPTCPTRWNRPIRPPDPGSRRPSEPPPQRSAGPTSRRPSERPPQQAAAPAIRRPNEPPPQGAAASRPDQPGCGAGSAPFSLYGYEITELRRKRQVTTKDLHKSELGLETLLFESAERFVTQQTKREFMGRPWRRD